MSDSWSLDEDVPPLSVTRARGPASSRFFIPIAPTPGKIGPSQAVKATPPAAPSAPTTVVPAAAKETDPLQQAAELWNKSVESGDRMKRVQELEDLLMRSARDALQPIPPQEPTPAGELVARGATPITDAPVSGSYEAKNRAWESSGSDTAVNKDTGAAGRYQFMPATAEGLRKQFPHLNISDNWRTNPEDQEKLMKAYTDISRTTLKPILGRDPTGAELYALHLFGHGKGPSIVQGGNKPLTELTTAEERRVNPFLNNFRTAADLMRFFGRKFN